MDWTAQPPSSQLFQEKLEGFVNAVAADSAQVNTNEFNSISGTQEQPPDKDALEDAEKKLLATYNPEHTKDLIYYNLKDTKTLVKKMYAKKGLEAVIEKSNQGTNVFEIVETKELNPTIIWEDDPISEVNRKIIRGENRIEVPLYASDTAAGLDPFFEPLEHLATEVEPRKKSDPGDDHHPRKQDGDHEQEAKGPDDLTGRIVEEDPERNLFHPGHDSAQDPLEHHRDDQNRSQYEQARKEVVLHDQEGLFEAATKIRHVRSLPQI
jgi:hypothetical protein